MELCWAVSPYFHCVQGFTSQMSGRCWVCTRVPGHLPSGLAPFLHPPLHGTASHSRSALVRCNACIHYLVTFQLAISFTFHRGRAVPLLLTALCSASNTVPDPGQGSSKIQLS